MGSPSTSNTPSSEQPPIKPNPFRAVAVIAAIFGAIGTAATIVGGGILISYHDLTVDDRHTRRAAGITTVVIGALMIPPTLLIGAYDAYRWWKWYQWNKTHTHQANGVVESNTAPAAPTAVNSTTETTQQTTAYDYNEETHAHNTPTTITTHTSASNIQPIQIVTVS